MKIINIKNKALKSAFLTVLFYVIYFFNKYYCRTISKIRTMQSRAWNDCVIILTDYYGYITNIQFNKILFSA